MRERESDVSFKSRASALAASVTDPDKLLEIVVPPGASAATLAVVDRRPRLR